MDERFEYIKEQAKAMAKRQSACKEGFKRLVEAENFGQFCAVLQKYWSEIVPMIRKDGFQFFREVYPNCREELNRCGIFFNESTDKGMVILTDDRSDYIIGGTARVWIYNNTLATVMGHVRAVAFDEAELTVTNYAHALLLNKSYAQVTDRASASLRDESRVEAYDSCSITAGEDSSVTAHSWNTITAVGNAQVFAPSSYKIKLLGQAKLTIKKPEDL